MKAKKESPPADANWYKARCDVYQARVFMFLGSREEMVSSAADALCGDKIGMSIEDAKFIAIRLKEAFGKSADGVNGECLSMRDVNGARIWIVRLENFDGSVDDAVVLSHECLHAALSILGECGVSENPPFEALCYLHESIFRRFMIDAYKHIGMLNISKGEK